MNRCSGCGRFLGKPAKVIRIRDSVHPYTADYAYLCGGCAHEPTEPTGASSLVLTEQEPADD